jgi:hypothetical protein
MKVLERVTAALLGGQIDAIVTDRVAAALKDARVQAAATSLDEPGFRKLTGEPLRELLIAPPEVQQRITYFLWKTNPLAKWLVNIVAAFVLAQGLPFEADDDDVKDVLKKFWGDAINNLDLEQGNFLRQLAIFGEQCWPVFVAEQTGMVRLGYLDPENIKEVVRDPENVRVVIGIVAKPTAIGAGGSAEGRKYRVILHPDAEPFLSADARAWREENAERECFYFAINKLSNEERGSSDLFVLADWLDGYEQFLFDFLERWPQQNAFIWDVLLAGADDKAIEDWVKKNGGPPKPGSIRAHNEKCTWTAVSPELKTIEAETGARVVRNHVLGASGLPEHWFGGGGDVNRATAAEMGAPAFRLIEDRQKVWKFVLETMFRYVIRKAREKNVLRVDDAKADAFSVQTYQLDKGDLSKFAAAVQSLAAALTAAQTQGWLTPERAAQIFAFGLSFIGYELDADDAADEAKNLDEAKGYDDYTKRTAGTPGTPGTDGTAKTT